MRQPTFEPTGHHTLAEVAKRVPKAVSCLLTALRFHNLGTQNPREVWLAVDRRAGIPRVDFTPIRTVRLSGAALTAGIDVHNIEGVKVRVTSPARTVVDCFKFRNKIGIDVAVGAANASGFPVVRALVQADAQVNARSKSRDTALSIAERYGNGAVVEILKQAGAVKRGPHHRPVQQCWRGSASHFGPPALHDTATVLRPPTVSHA